jgi:hypothetical protein
VAGPQLLVDACVKTGRFEVRKRFFLKKEARTFTRLSQISRRQPGKRFLVLFSKKNRFLAHLQFDTG